MSSRPRWIFLALLFAAVGSWWLAAGDNGDTPPPETGTPQQPGYYLKGARFEQTDDDGRTYLKVTTERASQDPVSQEIELEPVRVDYFPPGGSPWLLTAKHGRLPPGARIISLTDDVTATGTPATRSPPAVMHSSLLSLDTATSVATTSAPVRIDFGHQVVLATGMRADLKNDHVALDSNVRGRYVR